MNISYHAWKDYTECPKKFDLKYIRKAEPSVPKNDYFALYGKLTEKFFQMFCNIWRFKTPSMSTDLIRDKTTILYKSILDSSTVNWDCRFATETKFDILENSIQDICAIMSSENRKYFLNTKSEVGIELKLKGSTNITGRLDFLQSKPEISLDNIFDGKGTKNIGKNISENQLLFYALLYYFHFKKLPGESGFFYYRFNTFAPVEITVDRLNEFRAELSRDIKVINSTEIFKATPCNKACKYCEFQTTCTEKQEWEVSRKKPSKLCIEETKEPVQEFGF